MNAPDKTQIEALLRADLPDVAVLHLQTFPDSLLSTFGRETIIKYYSWQMMPPNHCHALGIFTEDKLEGFCFAGSLRNAEIYFIQDKLLFFIWFFIRHPLILFDKRVIKQFGNTIKNYINHFSSGDWKRSKQGQVKSDEFGVLSIGIDPKSQRSGLGRMLMTEVEKIAMSEGVQKLNLTVHPENNKAVSFYEKMGWVKVSSSGCWQGYMEKELG